MLSLDINLMPGWSKQAVHISDFTELHWQTGAVLSTEGKCRGTWRVHEGSARIQNHPSLKQTLQRKVQEWAGKSPLQKEPEVQGSFSQLSATCSHSIRNCITQWISKMSLLQSPTGTHLEELPWESQSLFFFCLNGKWKNMSKVPKVITVPSHPSEILRPGKRSCAQAAPPRVLTTRDVGAAWWQNPWDLCSWDLRNLATHAEHTIWKRSATSSSSSSSQAMKPGSQRMAGFFQVCSISCRSLGSGSCMITWDFPSIHLKMQL